jgi:hypothetical protein
MANTTNDSIPLSGVPTNNTVLQTDSFLMVTNTSNPTVVQSPVANIFSNISISINSLVINTNTTPANSTSIQNIITGSIWSDGNYIYVGCSGNIIKRTLLSLF